MSSEPMWSFRNMSNGRIASQSRRTQTSASTSHGCVGHKAPGAGLKWRSKSVFWSLVHTFHKFWRKIIIRRNSKILAKWSTWRTCHAECFEWTESLYRDLGGLYDTQIHSCICIFYQYRKYFVTWPTTTKAGLILQSITLGGRILTMYLLSIYVCMAVLQEGRL